MSTDATLLVNQPAGLQPRRVRLFSRTLEELGDAMLGADTRSVSFDVAPGPYVIQVEQMGLPHQHMPVIAGAGVTEIALDPPEMPPPQRRPAIKGAGFNDSRTDDRDAQALRGAALLPADPPRQQMRRSRSRRGSDFDFGAESVDSGFSSDWSSGRDARLPGLSYSQGNDILHCDVDGNFYPQMDRIGSARAGRGIATVGPLVVEDSPFEDDALIFLPAFTGRLTIEKRGDAYAVSHVHAEDPRRNPVVPALLSYLDRDRTEGAGDFADLAFAQAGDISDGVGLDQLAFVLLREKFLDPYQAALAGHFLLRHARFDLLRDWTRNLADYFPYLSDGLVLEGWRRLSVSGSAGNPPLPDWRRKNPPPASWRNPDPNAARPDDPVEDATLRFLDAVERGLPNFEFGCRKLLEGLVFCYDQTPRGSHRRDDLEAAASRLARQMEDVGSTAGLTTVYRSVDHFVAA